MQDQKKENSDSEERKPVVIRNCTDLQRLKLEKLMQNPDKPIIIPERTKERGMPIVPDFVRNVMGSSAGAGSGEFHVYRHLRRKEYARQKYMKERAEKEKLEEEYHTKLEDNKKLAEEKTAKKRMKRLKRKERQKIKCKRPKITNKLSEDSESADDNEDDTVDTVESSVAQSKCAENNQDNINKISDASVNSEIANQKHEEN